jgi:4-coumarate--CoA ligase
MTESSPITHMSPIINNEIGSFGEPVSRTRVKTMDLNTGESLRPGQEGEMCVFGPQVMKGYYTNEKATEETIDSAGWLHTGDIAYYNEQDQFFIVDRLKELIKVKGLQVCSFPIWGFILTTASTTKLINKSALQVGETGVKWDTGSKGTVGGKIVDVNKTLKILSMLCKSV